MEKQEELQLNAISCVTNLSYYLLDGSVLLQSHAGIPDDDRTLLMDAGTTTVAPSRPWSPPDGDDRTIVADCSPRR